jgi:hypothetical protein
MSLIQFVRESNRIEGIQRDPTQAEVDATDDFIHAPHMTIVRVKAFVGVVQPNARIRDREGLNVRVGPHIPPPGGGYIVTELEALLDRASGPMPDPYTTHHEYETLHPFTDGNGRSGRALWLWQMLRIGYKVPNIGFLHTWYYQSLQAGRAFKSPSTEGATSVLGVGNDYASRNEGMKPVPIAAIATAWRVTKRRRDETAEVASTAQADADRAQADLDALKAAGFAEHLPTLAEVRGILAPVEGNSQGNAEAVGKAIAAERDEIAQVGFPIFPTSASPDGYGKCEVCGKPVYPPTNRYMAGAYVFNNKAWHGDCFPRSGISGTTQCL